MEELLNGNNFRSLVELENTAELLNVSGIYAIRLKLGHALPEFEVELQERETSLIYIGKGQNLRTRLRAECRGIGHGTFFRGIGAILNYMPPQGSLIGMANKYNYVFFAADREEIVDWINENLEFSFVEVPAGINEIEIELITEYMPVLNSRHNPQPLELFSELRENCRNYALQHPE